MLPSVIFAYFAGIVTYWFALNPAYYSPGNRFPLIGNRVYRTLQPFVPIHLNLASRSIKSPSQSTVTVFSPTPTVTVIHGNLFATYTGLAEPTPISNDTALLYALSEPSDIDVIAKEKALIVYTGDKTRDAPSWSTGTAIAVATAIICITLGYIIFQLRKEGDALPNPDQGETKLYIQSWDDNVFTLLAKLDNNDRSGQVRYDSTQACVGTCKRCGRNDAVSSSSSTTLTPSISTNGTVPLPSTIESDAELHRALLDDTDENYSFVYVANAVKIFEDDTHKATPSNDEAEAVAISEHTADGTTPFIYLAEAVGILEDDADETTPFIYEESTSVDPVSPAVKSTGIQAEFPVLETPAMESVEIQTDTPVFAPAAMASNGSQTDTPVLVTAGIQTDISILAIAAPASIGIQTDSLVSTEEIGTVPAQTPSISTTQTDANAIPTAMHTPAPTSSMDMGSLNTLASLIAGHLTVSTPAEEAHMKVTSELSAVAANLSALINPVIHDATARDLDRDVRKLQALIQMHARSLLDLRASGSIAPGISILARPEWHPNQGPAMHSQPDFCGFQPGLRNGMRPVGQGNRYSAPQFDRPMAPRFSNTTRPFFNPPFKVRPELQPAHRAAEDADVKAVVDSTPELPSSNDVPPAHCAASAATADAEAVDADAEVVMDSTPEPMRTDDPPEVTDATEERDLRDDSTPLLEYLESRCRSAPPTLGHLLPGLDLTTLPRCNSASAYIDYDVAAWAAEQEARHQVLENVRGKQPERASTESPSTGLDNQIAHALAEEEELQSLPMDDEDQDQDQGWDQDKKRDDTDDAKDSDSESDDNDGAVLAYASHSQLDILFADEALVRDLQQLFDDEEAETSYASGSNSGHRTPSSSTRAPSPELAEPEAATTLDAQPASPQPQAEQLPAQPFQVSDSEALIPTDESIAIAIAIDAPQIHSPTPLRAYSPVSPVAITFDLAFDRSCAPSPTPMSTRTPSLTPVQVPTPVRTPSPAFLTATPVTYSLSITTAADVELVEPRVEQQESDVEEAKRNTASSSANAPARISSDSDSDLNKSIWAPGGVMDQKKASGDAESAAETPAPTSSDSDLDRSIWAPGGVMEQKRQEEAAENLQRAPQGTDGNDQRKSAGPAKSWCPIVRLPKTSAPAATAAAREIARADDSHPTAVMVRAAVEHATGTRAGVGPAAGLQPHTAEESEIDDGEVRVRLQPH